MMRELRVEIRKTRRRFLWLMPIGVAFMELLLLSTNSYLRKPEIAPQLWSTLLFQLPLYNTIFCPLVLAALASRVCDSENKGNTYKLLCTLQQKKHIFDVKVLLGALYVLFLTALEAVCVLLLGVILPVSQAFPLRHYLIFLAVLFLVSLSLYVMQLILSLMMTSQLIPLFIGLLGSLVGLFSAFFPIGKLAAAVPWGYYLIGSTFASWYDRESRITYLYEIPFQWELMALFAALSLFVCLAGRHFFLKKEV